MLGFIEAKNADDKVNDTLELASISIKLIGKSEQGLSFYIKSKSPKYENIDGCLLIDEE